MLSCPTSLSKITSSNFDIDRILRDPPVLRALTYLFVPNEYIGHYSGYSIHSVLSWRAGRQRLSDDATERLIGLAGCVIQAIEETWDQSPPETRTTARTDAHPSARARALVALQRSITQDDDLPVEAADYLNEASQIAERTQGE
jgi:hypothetical protein